MAMSPAPEGRASLAKVIYSYTVNSRSSWFHMKLSQTITTKIKNKNQQQRNPTTKTQIHQEGKQLPGATEYAMPTDTGENS